jgi:RNA polymerase subunit RPABC4/transcription elongation factor Spt4
MKSNTGNTNKDTWCPYCEDELAKSQLPYCQPCKVEMFNCPECGRPTPRKNRVCPACGAEMKPKTCK